MGFLGNWIRNLFSNKTPVTENSEMYDEEYHGLVFTCRDVYLGKEGILDIKEYGHTIYLFYSSYDGIGWKLKSHEPYAVLFDFNDVGYFINDPKGFDYAQIVQELSGLKDAAREMDHKAVIQRLEEITAQFVAAYYSENVQ